MRKLTLFAGALTALLLGACRTYPDYSSDFRFPIERGNIDAGREAFVALDCHRCHSVDGVELPAWPGDRPLTVQLGGDLIFAKTYGDLVTSIINPDHILSERYLEQMPSQARRSQTSPMPFYDDMTVRQMLDVVSFLNSRYRLLPGYTEYYY